MSLITSPAPWKRKTLSLSFLPVILSEAKTPAVATDAVPEVETILYTYLLPNMIKVINYLHVYKRDKQ